MHDPKAYSKGGTLENTINGARGPAPGPAPQPDEEAVPPPHLIHASKVQCDKLLRLYNILNKAIVSCKCELFMQVLFALQLCSASELDFNVY